MGAGVSQGVNQREPIGITEHAVIRRNTQPDRSIGAHVKIRELSGEVRAAPTKAPPCSRSDYQPPAARRYAPARRYHLFCHRRSVEDCRDSRDSVFCAVKFARHALPVDVASGSCPEVRFWSTTCIREVLQWHMSAKPVSRELHRPLRRFADYTSRCTRPTGFAAL